MSDALYKASANLLADECGTICNAADGRLTFAICFANTYYIGMSNLGLQAVYALVNAREDAVCERAFLPDVPLLDEYVRSRTPLFSLESQRPLREFDLVGFTLPFEYDYVNVIRMLELAGISVRADDRDESEPLVIIGGPCASYNPEPLAGSVDLCVIGDAEPTLPVLLDRVNSLIGPARSGPRRPRREVLEACAEIPGVYVPAVHGGVTEVVRQGALSLDEAPAFTRIFTPHTEFDNMLMLEISRGCVRACRFCVTGRSFRPQREVSIERAVQIAAEHGRDAKTIGLVGPSVGDVSAIEPLCEALVTAGHRISLSSLRIEKLTPRLLEFVVAGGQRNITLAPEAGTQRMRRVIAKTMTDEQIVEAGRMAGAQGIQTLKLYFIIGIPTETDADVAAIIETGRRVQAASGIRRVLCSISPLIPKPQTPFQWLGMDTIEELNRKAKLLQRLCKQVPGLELKVDSVRWGHLQAILARGDRRLTPALIEVAQSAGSFSDWRTALAHVGIDALTEATRHWPQDAALPWDFIVSGNSYTRFWQETSRVMERAAQPALALLAP